MVSAIIQALLALALMGGAISVFVLSQKQKKETWKMLLSKVNTENCHLASLSYGCIFSEGLQCASDRLWSQMGRTQGLYAIYANVGVLLRVLEYLETISINNASVISSIVRAKRKARITRFEVICISMWAVTWMYQGSFREQLGRLCDNYFTVIATVSILIQDEFPDLLDAYREEFGSI